MSIPSEIDEEEDYSDDFGGSDEGSDEKKGGAAAGGSSGSGGGEGATKERRISFAPSPCLDEVKPVRLVGCFCWLYCL